ncbi:hypothetical protein OTK49_28360 [Vibrio coralliirubri]|uniref:hypothetical protein n=1 Tax=Vibrio coralliirubri TaxID=1516159 RepID=UPI0022848A4B|nr:hypothetical protein [Vibrio coralliirubri]MCY9866457.1 hypothetical protein [Vibrio coralliirubri]
MNYTNRKLAAETALKAVFDFESDKLASEVKEACPLWLFEQFVENQRLELILPSGNLIEVKPYFEIQSNNEANNIFALLEAIYRQTELTLAKAEKANSDTIETYDTYVVAQDQYFWKLTPTQFISMCMEGVKTGGHTLPDTLKMLKTAPKDIKRFGYDSYYSEDKTILACSPLNWDESDYAAHLKKLGIIM